VYGTYAVTSWTHPSRECAGAGRKVSGANNINGWHNKAGSGSMLQDEKAMRRTDSHFLQLHSQQSLEGHLSSAHQGRQLAPQALHGAAGWCVKGECRAVGSIVLECFCCCHDNKAVVDCGTADVSKSKEQEQAARAGSKSRQQEWAAQAHNKSRQARHVYVRCKTRRQTPDKSQCHKSIYPRQAVGCHVDDLPCYMPNLPCCLPNNGLHGCPCMQAF